MKKSILVSKVIVFFLFGTTLVLIGCKKNSDDITNGKVQDIDGNVYKTVAIGSQVWMTENLKVTHYRNGDPIPLVTGANEWSFLATGAYCYYDNSPGLGQTYGMLYNWHALTDSRNLAPKGWRIPTDADWTALMEFLGGWETAGGKLKDTTLWSSPNTGATNETGFSALPGGYRWGDDGSFDAKQEHGTWWSSTEYDAEYAWCRFIPYYSDNVSNYEIMKTCGASVRCIKD